MVCKHLKHLEVAIIDAGFTETFRGKAWSKNCREWVYFDCLLDSSVIRESFDLAPCVRHRVNDDPKNGRESGFVCATCNDAVMGLNPVDAYGKKKFPRTES
ncbi:hypothetical protein HG15A2_27160 [Adhaeretor mobilis]|uniref:Uncharacterized protein n=1 Tax=Adhaeretor mobilis TaxID=1930276 RepID=A0A517MWZ1_9BACT|nr:hypothetical protein HG15A2_27160 [Adhaeretor mobilis]